jgi:hypothetical protein
VGLHGGRIEFSQWWIHRGFSPHLPNDSRNRAAAIDSDIWNSVVSRSR